MKDNKSIIIEKCMNYINAFAKNDSTIMDGLFHERALIYGNISDNTWVGSPDDLAQLCDSNPPIDLKMNTDPIEIIEISEKSCVAKLTVNNYDMKKFIEFFLMHNIDGDWVVIGKSFYESF